MSPPRTASAVLIGGGVVGCSIAYHLARRGLPDVGVLAREPVRPGPPSAFARRGRGLGVKILEGVEVTALEQSNGRVTGAQPSQRAIASPIVVNAAGPAAARVGRLAGLELPVHPRRRHIFFTEPFPEIPGPVPLTSDVTSGLYFRKELEQVLLSPGDVEDIGEDFNVPMDWGKVEDAVQKAIHRLPILEHARIAGGWAGLRPLTPDDHAIIGWAPGVEGFFLAVGFGGHGFQHSPATGRYVAEWLLDGKPSLDLSLFDPSRFARGRAGEHDRSADAE